MDQNLTFKSHLAIVGWLFPNCLCVLTLHQTNDQRPHLYRQSEAVGGPMATALGRGDAVLHPQRMA